MSDSPLFYLCEVRQMRGLSGSALKCIAIISMLIDHIGAAILARMIIGGNGSDFLYQSYLMLRAIGRTAFPIYCFLLVEGFEHTRDRKKYALRLLTFALISEIPFDLAFSSKVLEFEHQNVFFTLFIGLVTMMVFHEVEQKLEWHPVVRTISLVAIMLCGMGVAYLLRTDYDAKGVMCIMALYAFRKIRGAQILAGCIAFGWWEIDALVAFILIAFYNEKRGWNMKYLFYLFYPLHLLILYFVCVGMGIAGIAAV